MTKPRTKRQQAWKLAFLLFLCFFQVPNESNAQVGLLFGANYCSIRHDNLLQNVEYIIRPYTGVSVNCFPMWFLPELSIRNEFIITQKGYRQALESDYDLVFTYAAFPVSLNYKLNDYITPQIGLEWSMLLGSSELRTFKKYRQTDLGLILGLCFFECKKLSFYTRLTYGLWPMLKYESYDKYGNLTGQKEDLKHITFSLGIKLRLHHEEIRFYK